MTLLLLINPKQFNPNSGRAGGSGGGGGLGGYFQIPDNFLKETSEQRRKREREERQRVWKLNQAAAIVRKREEADGSRKAEISKYVNRVVVKNQWQRFRKALAKPEVIPQEVEQKPQIQAQAPEPEQVTRKTLPRIFISKHVQQPTKARDDLDDGVILAVILSHHENH